MERHSDRSDTQCMDSLQRSRESIEYTELLVDCMQARLEIARSLRQLADSQISAARDGEVNVTLGLIARKQALLESLASVARHMQPYFDDVPEQRLWRSPERREECRKISDLGSRLLSETLQLEQATLDEISRERDAVAAQLQDGKNSILARTAYSTDNLLHESALDISDL